MHEQGLTHNIDPRRPVFFQRHGVWHQGKIFARTAAEDIVAIVRSERTTPDRRVSVRQEERIVFIQPDQSLDSLSQERMDW